MQHNGDYPVLTNLQTGDPDEWTQLVEQTDIDGAAGTDYGPYLQKPPVNPFTGGQNVAADNTADWKYTEATGTIKAVIPNGKWAEIEELGLGTAADESGTENADVVQGPSS